MGKFDYIPPPLVNLNFGYIGLRPAQRIGQGLLGNPSRLGQKENSKAESS